MSTPTWASATGGAPTCSAPRASATTPSATPSLAAGGLATTSVTPVIAPPPTSVLASAVPRPTLLPPCAPPLQEVNCPAGYNAKKGWAKLARNVDHAKAVETAACELVQPTQELQQLGHIGDAPINAAFYGKKK